MTNSALIYCSLLPDEVTERGLESQSVELQTYCLVRDFRVQGLEVDSGSGSGLRPGLRRLLDRMQEEGIRHLVVSEPAKLARDPGEVLRFLRKLPDGIEIHFSRWGLSTQESDFIKWVEMTESFLQPGSSNPRRPAQKSEDALRLMPLWKRIFSMLRDERYAEALIQALFEIKDGAAMSDREAQAAHGGYDHLHMFRALGYRIKGEDTDNTRLVSDVIVRNWSLVRGNLAGEVGRLLANSES